MEMKDIDLVNESFKFDDECDVSNKKQLQSHSLFVVSLGPFTFHSHGMRLLSPVQFLLPININHSNSQKCIEIFLNELIQWTTINTFKAIRFHIHKFLALVKDFTRNFRTYLSFWFGNFW